MSLAARLKSRATCSGLARAKRDIADYENGVALTTRISLDRGNKGNGKAIDIGQLIDKYSHALNQTIEGGHLKIEDIYVTGRSTREVLIEACNRQRVRSAQIGHLVIRMIFDDNEPETYSDDLSWPRLCAIIAIDMIARRSEVEVNSLLSAIEFPTGFEFLKAFGVPGVGYLPNYFLNTKQPENAGWAYLMCYFMDYSQYLRTENERDDYSLLEYVNDLARTNLSNEGAVRAMTRQNANIHSQIHLTNDMKHVFSETIFHMRPPKSTLMVSQAAKGLIQLLENDGYEDYPSDPERTPEPSVQVNLHSSGTQNAFQAQMQMPHVQGHPQQPPSTSQSGFSGQASSSGHKPQGLGHRDSMDQSLSAERVLNRGGVPKRNQGKSGPMN